MVEKGKKVNVIPYHELFQAYKGTSGKDKKRKKKTLLGKKKMKETKGRKKERTSLVRGRRGKGESERGKLRRNGCHPKGEECCRNR